MLFRAAQSSHRSTRELNEVKKIESTREAGSPYINSDCLQETSSPPFEAGAEDLSIMQHAQTRSKADLVACCQRQGKLNSEGWLSLAPGRADRRRPRMLFGPSILAVSMIF